MKDLCQGRVLRAAFRGEQFAVSTRPALATARLKDPSLPWEARALFCCRGVPSTPSGFTENRLRDSLTLALETIQSEEHDEYDVRSYSPT